MAVHQLEEMDFFELKLLADKEGIFYVRDGEVFIYHGADKLKIDHNHPATMNPFGIPEVLNTQIPEADIKSFMIGNHTATRLDVSKDVKEHGCFWFWQEEEYFVLCFISDSKKSRKPTVHMLRAGNATDSL